MDNPPNVSIKICHLNIQSIVPKIDELKHFLATNSVSVCSVNETWLTKSKNLTIPNYNIVRKDRDSKGGGVLLLIHKSILFEEIQIQTNPELEVAIIKLPKITSDQKDLILATYYNPPQEVVDLSLLDSISKLGSHVLIVGDLNAHSPHWHSKREDQSGRNLINFIEAQDYFVINDDSPTYEPLHRPDHKAILDFGVCSESLIGSIQSFEVTDTIRSDHLPFIIEFKSSKKPSFGPTTKEIKSVDWLKYTVEVENNSANLNTENISTPDQLDAACEQVSGIILKSIEACTSVKTVKFNHDSLMVLPPKIVSLIKEKRKTRREFLKTRDPSLKTQLNKLTAQVSAEIRMFKQEKWEKFCTSLNTYQVSDSILWKKLKAIESSGATKPPKTPTLKVNNEIVDSPEQVANVFADNLENVFQDTQNPKTPKPQN